MEFYLGILKRVGQYQCDVISWRPGKRRWHWKASFRFANVGNIFVICTYLPVPVLMSATIVNSLLGKQNFELGIGCGNCSEAKE